MANWNDISFAPLQSDYIDRLNTLLNRSQAVATEVESARGSQASLLANLNYALVQKVNISGLAADFSLNGFRIRGGVAPAYPDELIIKSYADGLAFASALPAISSSNMGKEISNDGNTASWGISAFSGFNVAVSLGY